MSSRILAVDPGLTRCGVGVIEAGAARHVRLVDVDVLRTDAGWELADRLTLLDEQLHDWISRLRPDAVAVERVFAQHNVRTVTGTAQVAGLVMVAARRAGIPVASHTPSEVKAAVTGSGRAGKEQVQEMVRRILGLPQAPTPADAADALALAITHAWRRTQLTPTGRSSLTPAQRAWNDALATSRAPARRAPARRATR